MLNQSGFFDYELQFRIAYRNYTEGKSISINDKALLKQHGVIPFRDEKDRINRGYRCYDRNKYTEKPKKRINRNLGYSVYNIDDTLLCTILQHNIKITEAILDAGITNIL